MKKSKIFTRALSGFVFFLVLLFAIGFTNAEAATKLNAKNKAIYVGKTYTLKVLNTKATVKWKSSNKRVATVNKKGVVKGVKAGKAVVTAQVGKKKINCNVTVKNNVSVNKTSITLDKNKSITIKATICKNVDNINFKVSNPNIVSCRWGKWKQKTIPLKITANKSGSTTITITNTYSKEKLKLKVVVRQPWAKVKVVIPDTIGEQSAPENRMKITKYQFYQKSEYSSYYTMDIRYKLVQYNRTGRSNWGEYFICYDKKGNILKDCFLYAHPLTLNYTYRDTANIPLDTAKIVFFEYPDPSNGSNQSGNTNSGSNSNNNSSTDSSKWSTSDTQKIKNYVSYASNYAKQATTYASKYGAISKQYMNYAVSELQKAYNLTLQKAPVNLIDANGNSAGTLSEKISTTLAAYEGLDTLDNSNTSEISSMANNGNVKTASLKLLVNTIF